MTEKILQRLASGTLTRVEIARLRANAELRAAAGDAGAQTLLDAIHATAIPSDKYILFMGFCPGANFDNRLDIEWRERGTCYYRKADDITQLDRFQSLLLGDLIVLKKREEFGKTMQLYGHGRVKGILPGQFRDLSVEWSTQTEVITVPLMGCNSTVDIRTMDRVEGDMPEDFYRWLAVKNCCSDG